MEDSCRSALVDGQYGRVEAFGAGSKLAAHWAKHGFAPRTKDHPIARTSRLNNLKRRQLDLNGRDSLSVQTHRYDRDLVRPAGKTEAPTRCMECKPVRTQEGTIDGPVAPPRNRHKPAPTCSAWFQTPKPRWRCHRSRLIDVPNEAFLLRLVSALLTEISQDWETGKIYLNMDSSNPPKT
ncbi:MAG: hypothetical protein RIS24_2817 [Verrucomicrobiota bacterium]